MPGWGLRGGVADPYPARQPAGASRFARFGLKSPRSPEEGALRPEGWSGTRLPLSLSPEEGALRPEGWSGARLPLSLAPGRAPCARKAGLEPDFHCLNAGYPQKGRAVRPYPFANILSLLLLRGHYASTFASSTAAPLEHFRTETVLIGSPFSSKVICPVIPS